MVNQNRREFIGMLGAAALLPIGPYLSRSPVERENARSPSRFKVRTITAGLQIEVATSDAVERGIGMLRHARARLEAAGYQVEGVRIATSPFVSDVDRAARTRVLGELQALDRMLVTEHVSLSLGPVLKTDRLDPGLADWVAELARTTRNLTFSAMIASPERPVHRDACQVASEIMTTLSRAVPGGGANFRFAALANMPPGSPFFPGGYHQGAAASFSIGLESPLLVHDAFASATDPVDAESRLRDSMNAELGGIERAALRIAQEEGYEYLGIDPSPAPSHQSSIGAALEALTHVPFGSASTLQACAAVTAAIKSLRVRTCGYAGLMLPVLEDPTLAARATEGRYGIRELLLYSSVCGTGLDCVPIPGDTPPARIASLLGDVATMSSRLRKPLSARLFPAPGKKAGDPIQFEDSFLEPSVVFDVA
jgi:uncharacterized protein (UPF0210 family)